MALVLPIMCQICVKSPQRTVVVLTLAEIQSRPTGKSDTMSGALKKLILILYLVESKLE